MDLNETKDATSKGSKRAWLALIFAFLLALSGVVAYLTAHDSVTNLFSFADEDKDVTVEWREVPPTVDVNHDGSFLVVRVAWNNTTAKYVEGSSTTTLNAYSVGNEGSYDAPDPYIFLADTMTEEQYQALLIGSEVNVTNSVVPIPTGNLFYIEKDRGNTEHPTKNGVTYSKYRMTVKPYTTTVIKESQLKKLLSVQPVEPQWSGYVHNGWTTPVKVGTDPDTGNDKYVVKSTWVKRSNPDVTEDSSYAAVYGDDTLVFGRGAAPGSYEGKPLSAQNGVACTWYDIEDAVYSRVELPWRDMKPNIKSVVVQDTIAPKSIAFWFETMGNLTSVDLSKLDASKVEDAQSLFGNDALISTIDLSMLDMPKVKNISNMFYGCKGATSLMIPGGLTSELKEMGQVFYDCISVKTLDLEGLDISGVTNMNRLFWNCPTLTTVFVNENWNVDHIRAGIAEGIYDDHGQMFSGCTNLVGGNGTKCENRLGEVSTKASIQYANIDKWNVAGYLTCFNADTGKVLLKGDPSPGSILTATTQSIPSGKTLDYQWLRDGSPIPGATDYQYTASDDDVEHKISCQVVVDGRYTLVSNTVSVGLPAFAVYSTDDNSLNFYKRSGVPSAGEAFEGKAATEVYTGFEEQAARPWSGQAANVTSVTFVDEGITPVSTTSWFSAFTKLLDINGLSKLDTSKVTSMQNMFNNCRSLTSFDISSFDTSQVTDMRSMFNGCYKLTSLDLSNFNTSNVTNMKMMFTNCSALTSLDLSSFDASGASDISFMFSNCKTLETIFVAPGVDWSSVQTSTNMFISCSKLTGGNGTKYDQTKIDAAYARIDGLNGQPGYFTDKNAPEKTEVEKQLESMTLHEKVCQMFCVYPEDLGGSGALTVAGSTQQKTLQSYPYGGVCYFLQNIKSESQAKTLVSTIESYSEVPMFHAVDEEGGRVQRIGGTTYSGAVRGAGIGNQLNAMYTYKDLGTDTAYNNAQLLAANLNLLGMNWDFAPVADVNSNPSNPVIGDRAYGDDFDATGELVASAVRGFNDAGVATALKHFPGHGDTATDSHTGAASVSKTLDQLRNEEFKSFKAGIAAGADSVMMGHLMIEGAKESVPTSCSYEFVTEVLRNELGFDGVITTDGMGMGAITKVYGTTKQGHIDAVMACLNAGIDVFLLPGDPAACVDAIEAAIANGEVSEERIDASVKRILTLKEKIAANKSKRNAATLQAMHAAAVADEELTKAATKATSVEPTVSVEANAESVAVGNKAMLSATTEGIDETDHVEYRWFVSSNSDMADKSLIEGAVQTQIEYLFGDPGTWHFQCEVIHGEESILSKPVAIEAYTPEGGQ